MRSLKTSTLIIFAQVTLLVSAAEASHQSCKELATSWLSSLTKENGQLLNSYSVDYLKDELCEKNNTEIQMQCFEKKYNESKNNIKIGETKLSSVVKAVEICANKFLDFDLTQRKVNAHLASEFSGERNMLVCGKVVNISTGYTIDHESGRWVNFEHAFPNQPFEVFIRDNVRKGKDFPVPGNEYCVRGNLGLHAGNTLIKLENMNDIALNKASEIKGFSEFLKANKGKITVEKQIIIINQPNNCLNCHTNSPHTSSR